MTHEGSRIQVFISYCHEGEEHAKWVAALSQRLRVDGFDTEIDQYVGGTPPEGWPRWILDRLDWAHFVLLICTAEYYRRFRGHGAADVGRGVDWEGALITDALYQAKSRSTQFVPVVRSADSSDFVPEPLRPHTLYCLKSEEEYVALVRFLRGEAGIARTPLGPVPAPAHRTVEPLTFPSAPPEGAPARAAPVEKPATRGASGALRWAGGGLLLLGAALVAARSMSPHDEPQSKSAAAGLPPPAQSYGSHATPAQTAQKPAQPTPTAASSHTPSVPPSALILHHTAVMHTTPGVTYATAALAQTCRSGTASCNNRSCTLECSGQAPFDGTYRVACLRIDGVEHRCTIGGDPKNDTHADCNADAELAGTHPWARCPQ